MRRHGWEGRLAEYLAAGTRFQWGKNDCALWAAGWVRDCTGQDFTDDWVGTYKTAAGSRRRMKTLGYSGVADIAARHLPGKPVALARRGDLVLHPSGALGICDGRLSHFLTTTGRTAEPTLACPRAWGVG